MAEKVGCKPKQQKNKAVTLLPWQNPDKKFEMGVDEAGRGCLLGRVYVAAVVLPKTGFQFERMRDSKKFSNKETRFQVGRYIMENALAFHVSFVEASEINNINILRATMKGMNEAIAACFQNLGESLASPDMRVLIDGSYFDNVHQVDSDLVVSGDNTYCSIAAASILAKTHHDLYIQDLCREYPLLDIRYGLLSNMGYGTRAHMQGIADHGISQFHRSQFGTLCKNAEIKKV